MIEVGEYVRDNEGNIDKIINTLSLFKDVYLYLGEEGYQYSENAISKHSKNIIDLIEEGDYVNGQLIEKIYKKEKDKLFFEFLENKDGSYEVMQMCELENIKSIVTKEQMKAMEYKVKE